MAEGGENDFANIVYSCHQCNEFKHDYWNPQSVQRILHPLNEDITLHLRHDDDGTVAGLTETGRFHLTRLRLNRPGLVALRLEKSIRRRDSERIAALEHGITEVRAALEMILKRLPPNSE